MNSGCAFVAALLLLGYAQVSQGCAAQRASPSRRLERLFREADDANLKLNPLEAVFRGEPRFAEEFDKFGDYLTDAHIQSETAVIGGQLTALQSVDRDALTPEEQAAYDTFEWNARQQLRGLRPDF